LIPVARSSQPSVLSKNSTKWLDKLNQQQLQLQMLENDPNTGEAQIQKVKKCVDNAQKKYSHTQIKSALVDMFYGKCAYCESNPHSAGKSGKEVIFTARSTKELENP
jgi:hypothetical protein